MSDNSPTCILSSSCLQGPPHAGHHHNHPHHQRVSTISSEVDEISRETPTTCKRCLYLEHRGPACRLSDCPSNSCPVKNAISSVSEEKDGGVPRSSSGGSGSIALQTSHKSSKSGKMSGWKTSKFFSKTMSSGEILRSLKKLSLTSSAEEGESKSGDAKSLKSRLTTFKKRSSCGNEEVTVDVESLAAAAAVRMDQKSSRPPSLTDSASSQKSSQDEGIVCKKEDLKAILSGASKRLPFSSSSSPSTKRIPLRQTKSASFEPSNDGTRKDTVRRAGSEESRSKMALSLDNEDQAAKETDSEVFEDVVKTSECEDSSAEVEEEEELMSSSPDPLPLHAPVTEDCISTVKWDECEVVDAVIIGDAIETFLKGSMSGSEKRVSFRKS